MTTKASTSQMRVLPALRKATDIVIKFDPRTIVLTPHKRTQKPGGVYDWEAQKPRPAQQFSIEPVGSTLVGITSTAGGVIAGEGASTHQWSYYLVGRYDSQMAVGDTWVDGETTYRIIAMQPKNDYEKRAVVTAYGADPNYGS